MRPVELPEEARSEIETHAQLTYPEECCGFLLAPEGEVEAATRRVRSVLRAPNESQGERRRRFVITANELRIAEESARRAGSAVVGFYHSHPDHPARPSQFDQDHAWPWYSYLVVSVTRSPSEFEFGAFELDATSGAFERVPLTILRPAGASVPAGRE